MKKTILFIVLIAIISGCAEPYHEERSLAELPLPYVTEEMEDPGFWIEKMPSHAEVIMSEEEIAAFNQYCYKNGSSVSDVATFPDTVSRRYLRKKIESMLDWAESQGYLGHDDFPLPDSFFDEIEGYVNLKAVPEVIPTRWALVTRETNLRVLPTVEIALEEKDDYEFDYFQMGILSPGTPVAVLWVTRDGRWLFVVGPYSAGWVEGVDVGVLDRRDDVVEYVTKEPFQVVIGPRVDVYSDPGRTVYAGRLRLGSRVPLLGRAGDSYIVEFPARNLDGSLRTTQCYIAESAPAHRGWLPYTGENVIRVAFSMLGERYGWAGMWGYWDCSLYVRDVFLTFGIVLPRNSTAQAKVLFSLGRFDEDDPVADKLLLLDAAPPGSTLLMPSDHVMIYLGRHEGRHYIIHDTWAYRIKNGGGFPETVNIGRVVVSELTLGEEGKKGSLAERIRYVVEVRQKGE